MPSCTSPANCGVVAAIVEGRSEGTRYTPCSASLPYLLKYQFCVTSVSVNLRTPVPLYGHAPAVGSAAYETGEHCCCAYVCSTARSGMPTGWPALFLHVSAGFMLSRNSAVVPTRARELPHAVVMPF